ncbi:hypothetical protein ACFFX0_25130 [Citricoccus parietis]|uniref:Uncharacterized protein n=1 Tax=Citricoccus parietis TaxID=592307 RepID=A0ABV5G5Y6_9MICC
MPPKEFWRSSARGHGARTGATGCGVRRHGAARESVPMTDRPRCRPDLSRRPVLSRRPGRLRVRPGPPRRQMPESRPAPGQRTASRWTVRRRTPGPLTQGMREIRWIRRTGATGPRRGG